MRHEVIHLILAQESDQATFKKLKNKLVGQQDNLLNTRQALEDEIKDLQRRIEQLEEKT